MWHGKNISKQLKGSFLESITLEEFHRVENTHQISYKKRFDLLKKIHIWKLNEMISKNKVTQRASNIIDKRKLDYLDVSQTVNSYQN